MRGGYYCAVKSCSNSSQLRVDGTSFFSFPKDAERSKLWLEAIKREDLTNSTTEKLHKNYRICGLHFSQRMFKNDLRNRLFEHAYPDINCEAESEESANVDYITIIDLRDATVLPQFLQCDTDAQTENEAINNNENYNLCVQDRDVNSTEPMSIEVTVISDSDLNDTGGTLQLEQSISDAEDEVLATDHFADSMSPNIKCSDTLNSSNGGTQIIPLYHMDSAIAIFRGETKNVPPCVTVHQKGGILLIPACVKELINLQQLDACFDIMNTVGGSLELYILITNYDFLEIKYLKSAELFLEDEFSFYLYLVARTSVSCQTNSKLSNNTPRKQQLKTKVKLLQRKVRNLEEKLLKSQLVHQEEQCISLEKYFQYTDKLLPQKVANFVKAQVRLFQQSKNGRKYSQEFKQDCLNMFLNGPKAYKSLSETFALPTPRCLQRCSQQSQTTEALDEFELE